MSSLTSLQPDGKIFQENYYISQFNNHILSTHHYSHLIDLLSINYIINI